MAVDVRHSRRSWFGIALPAVAVVIVLALAGIVLMPDDAEPRHDFEDHIESRAQPAADAPTEITAPTTTEVARAPAEVRPPAPTKSPSASPPRETLPGRTGTLELLLAYATSRPVFGANVRVTSESFSRSIASDVQGRAAIAAIPPGPFEVDIEKLDELLRHHFIGQAVEGQTLATSLVLQPGTGVRGRVVDERGTPAALVRIADMKRLPWGKPNELARTAADGSFELVLAPGDGFSLNLWALHGGALRDAVASAPKTPWRLIFSRDDLASRSVDVTAAPGTWTRVDDVVLDAGSRIDVTVTDGVQPVKGAKVALSRDPAVPPTTLGPISLPTTETDERGIASLAGLPAGVTCSVLVTHPQFMPYHSDLLPPLARGDTTPLAITLERGATIQGQVRAKGDLGQGLHVRLFQSGPRDVFARALKVVECDREGRFALSGLVAGTYDLEARSSNQRVALRDHLQLAQAQQLTGVELTASESLAITIEISATDSTRGNRIALEAWDPASGSAEPVARRFLVLAGKGPRFGPFYVDTPHTGPFTLKLTTIATPGNFTQPIEHPGVMAGQKVLIDLDASR